MTKYSHKFGQIPSLPCLLMQICSVQWDANGCLWSPQVLVLVQDIQGLLIDSNYRTWWLSVNVGWLLTSTDTNYLSSLNIFNTATSRVFYPNPSGEIICNILNMLSSEDVRMCHCIGMPWIIPKTGTLPSPVILPSRWWEKLGGRQGGLADPVILQQMSSTLSYISSRRSWLFPTSQYTFRNLYTPAEWLSAVWAPPPISQYLLAMCDWYQVLILTESGAHVVWLVCVSLV